LEDADNAFANSVFVAGNDVYVAGASYIESGSDRVATLWKNGVKQNFDYNNSDVATSVFVAGNDVYVTGSGRNGALWKNGTYLLLYDVNEANSVFVLGNDVYVAGSAGIATTEGGPVAAIWKNGVKQDLTNKSSIASATSVFVSGNDIYASGYVNGVVTLWKNGVIQNLESTYNAANSSVFVSDNNVYVISYSSLWINGKAVYWGGGLNAIFVK
jgi:hypothetical protein